MHHMGMQCCTPAANIKGGADCFTKLAIQKPKARFPNYSVTFKFQQMKLLQLDPLHESISILDILLLLTGAALICWLLILWVRASRSRGARPHESVAGRHSDIEESRSGTEQTHPEAEGVPAVHQVDAEPILSAPDNLKLLEGIGPKIEELLYADGIHTFARLAVTTSEHLTALLKAAGSRFQSHNPSSWPEQAALARDGKWEELKTMQRSIRKKRT
jgi:predicted flap endonuclease-1-like 5' DNA nuclease